VLPTAEHFAVLRTLSVDGVIDVGANRGQFTLDCLLALPALPIVAFEPIPAAASVYRMVHGGIPRIKLIESALGEASGTATLHLSRSTDCSSLLPIGRVQAELFRNTDEIGTMEVPVRRLDDATGNLVGCSRLLLKLDVQGFELNVLRGAVTTLRSCAYVYAECSEVALYDGQALTAEIASFLKKQGFVAKGGFNGQWHAGRLIQADYLFAREAD